MMASVENIFLTQGLLFVRLRRRRIHP